ncbi:MAG: hypothetical protein ACLFPQ_04665 [Candidatus Woesearchaeota archaeon]
MIVNLISEHNLRGYAFEHVAKIVLRREKKNNFIFQVVQFDSIDDIINKYRISIDKSKKRLLYFIKYLRVEWGRCDLLEFVLNNKHDRVLENIVVYEVKSKIHTVKRSYIEMCQSNHIFVQNCRKLLIDVTVVSIMLFDRWRFSFNLIPYEKLNVRIYSNYKEK